jgi:large subunit ribosomal protein L22
VVTQARARFVRVSARKARLVLDQIRGRPVGEALTTLDFTPRAAARLIAKVLRSAVANAEHNHQVRNLEDLHVVRAVADSGPSMKRVQPRAMGRAFFIRHQTSHLTIGVSDEIHGVRGRRPRRASTEAPARRAAPGRPQGATGSRHTSERPEPTAPAGGGRRARPRTGKKETS